MKRPLFIAAVIVLSGIICGIKESGNMMKGAAIFIIAVLWVMIFNGVSEKKDAPFSFAEILGLPVKLSGRQMLTLLMLSLFAVGFARGAFVSHQYNKEESRSFYAAYAATNPGQFDYAGYLKGMGIHTAAEYETYKNGYSKEEAPLFYALAELRSYCAKLLSENLSEHDAGIFKAIVLGEKSEMDTAVRDLYQAAGISHILAVSGLHVGMLGSGLFDALRKRMSRKTAAILSSVLMFLYMLMTGASGSVVRAVIMLIFGFAAAVCGRSYDMRSALSASMLILILWRPYQIFQSGFQLSFGAVAAITLVGETTQHRLELLMENAGNEGILRKRVSRKSKLPAAASMLIMSAGIQLATLPITAYHYYVFPVYGILLNIIVVPLMTGVLASGLAVLVFAAVIQTAARLLPFAANAEFLCIAAVAPGHYILRLYEYLSSYSLRLPGAVVVIGRPGTCQILFYYLLLAAVILGITSGRIRKKQELGVRIIGLILSVLLLSNILRHYDCQEFYVEVLDVGQGDCFFIKNGKYSVLLDGGSTSRKGIGKDVIEAFLLSRGIDRLDAVILSHKDQDHVNGIEYLLSKASRVKVDTLILPAPAKESEEYDDIKSAFAKEEKIRYPGFGTMAMETEDFFLRCLFPGAAGESNAHSCAWLLQKEDFSMLFTGDLPCEYEGELCRAAKEYGCIPDEGIDILKCGHHGSSSSTSKQLLETFCPSFAIVSCAGKNRYGHPHQETLERLEEFQVEVLRTSEGGALEIHTGYIRKYNKS